MERAVAYIRVSDSRQATDGGSLVSQEAAVRAHAERRGYTLVRVFVEEGEAAKTELRTQLQEMLRYLTRNKGTIQVLIFPKIDRFSRRVADYTNLKVKLARLGVRLDSVGENLEDTPVGRFTEMVLASVAQFDNEVRAERCKGGMVQAVKEGRWVWKAPVGYRNVRRHADGTGGTGTIAPDPDVAPLVTEAFERMASGTYAPKQVHRWLELRGLMLSVSGFNGMLKNKLYMGAIEAFGGVYRATPPFVPLVDIDTFFRVQDNLRNSPSRRRTYDRDNPAFPLRGTLRCGGCGEYLTACFSRGERRTYAYYRCIRCRNVNLPREELEGLFATELASFRPHPNEIQSLREVVSQRWSETRSESVEACKRAEREIAEIEELRRSLALKSAGGVVPDDVARVQFEEFDIRLARLRESQREGMAFESQHAEVVAFAEEFLADLPGYWRRSGLAERKRLQSFLYGNGLTYTKDGRFRTEDYPLLEQTKGSLRRGNDSLVDRDAECTNALIDFMWSLYRAFGADNREEEDGFS